MLGIDDGGVHVSENPELVRHADVVAIRRHSVTDHAFAHLPVREWLDHFVLQRHAPDPAVWLDGHPFLLSGNNKIYFGDCRTNCAMPRDRKSTRLNSSHRCISYAVFCLKKNEQFNRPPGFLPRRRGAPRGCSNSGDSSPTIATFFLSADVCSTMQFSMRFDRICSQ